MKSWHDIGFEVEGTDDGSLSLRQLESVDPSKYRGESMHHSGGAWAETLLIYGAPIRETLEKIKNPRFMIVGLGMGYIEMTIAREALLLGKTAADVFLLTTYESVPELRNFFYLWLCDKKDQLHEEVWKTYQFIAADVVRETTLSVSQLKDFLKEHFKKESDLLPALTETSSFAAQYNCILYDAFSSKTTPFLWEESFLQRFLNEATAATCYFSTYACRVTLKKALSENGFEVVVRPGFVGKRNSTLGIKK